MDWELLDKYFHDRCSAEELEQVLEWFQTDEGQDFLAKDIDRQKDQFKKSEASFLYPPIRSDQLYHQILLDKKQPPIRRKMPMIRVASILLIGLVISALLYWSNMVSVTNESAEPSFTSYTTTVGQQKVLQLADGIKIRLNEQSTLKLQKQVTQKKQVVFLKGEAYFEVPHDSERLFIVNTPGATIEDMGTKFNVKSDTVAENVQVAVIKGKVALRKANTSSEGGAFLVKNNLGILELNSRKITIEQTEVKNYLSWINKRLVFNGEPLSRISPQLERLYDVSIEFQTDRLKELHLTANFEKANIEQVLQIVSRTLNINFEKQGRKVTWTE